MAAFADIPAGVMKIGRHAKTFAKNRGLHRFGYCSCCGRRGLFYAFADVHPDEELLYLYCRHRKVARTLLAELELSRHPSIRHAREDLSGFRILDSSGTGPMSRAMAGVEGWIRGWYGEGAPPEGCRLADLQRFPFENASLDVVVSEDVLEHVPDLEAAIREIGRALRPGGMHLFTMPYRKDAATVRRSEIRDGARVACLPDVFHHDPDTRRGVLVYQDIGNDFEDLCRSCGLSFETAPTPPGREFHYFGGRPVYRSRRLNETHGRMPC